MMEDYKNGRRDVDPEEQEVNLVEQLHVVLKWKGFIVKFCGIAAILSVLYSLSLPNIYSATAKVLPPQKEGGTGLASILGQAGLAGYATGLGFGGGSDLYVGILKSRSVGDAVIKDLDLTNVFKTKTMDDTRKRLQNAVKIQGGGKESLITITAEHKDPKLAAALANTYVEELGRRSVQLNLTKAGSDRVFLEKRLELVKAQLIDAEEALKVFQQKNKVVKVDAQAMSSIEGIARIKADIVAKEVQLASLTSYQTDESPEVKIVKAALVKLRSQLGRLTGGQNDSDGLPTMANAPNLGVEYVRMMRELKSQEAIYEQLRRLHEIALLNEAKDTSAVQVLDDAVVPTKKSKPKRSVIVLASTFAALVASIILAFIFEHFQKLPDEEKRRWAEIRSLTLRKNLWS